MTEQPTTDRPYVQSWQVDKAVEYCQWLGITLQPWQEAHLRALLNGGTITTAQRGDGLAWCQPCARWYRASADGTNYHGGCST